MQKLQGSETQLKEQVLIFDIHWRFPHVAIPWQSVSYLLELESVYPKNFFVAQCQSAYCDTNWQLSVNVQLVNAKKRECVMLVKLSNTEQEVVDLKVIFVWYVILLCDEAVI